MTKTLKDFLEVYKPKSPDEQKFVDKHVVIKHKDRNGNGDDVFNGNTKTIKRKEERHGYDAGEDEKVYEALKGDQHKIDANKNGKVDAHDFHLLRKKKKVAEETEELDELSTEKLLAYRKKAREADTNKHHVYADEADKKIKKKTGVYNPNLLQRAKAKLRNEGTEEVDESYQELMALKNNIARNEKKMNSIPGIHPEKKRLAIQIEKDTKRHKALFNKQMGKNESVEELDEKNQQYIEVVNAHTNSKSYTPVHKTKAFAALNHHRSFSHTKSARIIDQDQYDKIKAAKKDVKEEVDIDTVLDEALDLLMSIDEKTLTPAEMKKREEVVKAIKRDDPKMDKSMAYAIATKTAKRVAEGTMPTADEPTDANKKMAQKVRDLLAKEKKPVKEEAEELDEMSSYEVTGEHTDGHLKTLSYFAKSPAHAKSQFHAKQSKKDYTVKSVKKLAESAELDESAKIAAHLIKRYGDNVRKSHVVSAANDFGVDASKLAKAVRTKLGKNMLDEEDDGWYTHSQMYGSKKSEKHPKGISAAEWKTGIRWHHGKNKRINIKEDVEAIDELSKGTMLKYLSANKKSDKAAQEKGDFSKSDKRMRGTDVAVRKYTATNNKYVRVPATEEVKQVDELSSKKLTDYMDKASDARGHRNLSTKKVDNRYAGVKKASDKLTKEEVEVIDELSKKTLGSYTYQAASQLGSRGITTGLKIANDEPTEKNFKKMGNRQKGIATAVKKLTKEDVINRAVEKYVPEELKFTPEERLLKRINGLSEAHVNTILGLFEALNKDNQNKMIETAETREGINQILNFVLENRG